MSNNNNKKKIPARDWEFRISDGEDTPEFVEIDGIESFSIDPTETFAEGGDFGDGGWAEFMVIDRGLTISIEGFMKVDKDGNQDEGQKRVDDLKNKVGEDAMEELEIESPRGTKWTVTVSVSGSPLSTGGGRTDYTGWAASFRVSGKPEKED